MKSLVSLEEYLSDELKPSERFCEFQCLSDIEINQEFFDLFDEFNGCDFSNLDLSRFIISGKRFWSCEFYDTIFDKAKVNFCFFSKCSGLEVPLGYVKTARKLQFIACAFTDCGL